VGSTFANNYHISVSSTKIDNLANLMSLLNFTSYIALVSSSYTQSYSGSSYLEIHQTLIFFSYCVFPTDYTVYNKDRPDGYGKVFVACRESYVSYGLDLTVCSCELVVCEVKLVDNASLIVCSVYRPPSSDEHISSKILFRVRRHH